MPRRVRPPADVVTPPVPALFKAPKSKSHRRNQPRMKQWVYFTTAANELRASKTYRADFGSYAPDPEAFAKAFDDIARYGRELIAAKKWLSYIEEEQTQSWNRVLAFLRVFAPGYLVAAQHDEVALRYRALGALIRVRRKPHKKKKAPTPKAAPKK